MDLDFWEALGRLLTAGGLGAVIGLEREPAQRGAGLRTHVVVALGAALFVLAGAYGFADITDPGRFDPGRVAAQVATGVGFIGAGAIIRQGDSVSGVTTAATVWLAAAVGVMSAVGGKLIALTATVIAVAMIVVLGWAKPVLRRLQTARTVVEVQYNRGHGTLGPILRFLADSGTAIENLNVEDDQPDPEQPGLRSVRIVVSKSDHATVDGLIEILTGRPEVRSVTVNGQRSA